MPGRATGEDEESAPRPVSWRVLVVDDEPDVREVLADFLITIGHTVRAVPSGREALDHLALGVHPPYDLALVDWHMPGIGGRDVAQGIRDLAPTTRVLLTTGELTESIRGGKEGKCWVDVVRKPYSLRDLRDRMAKAMVEPPSPAPPLPDGSAPR